MARGTIALILGLFALSLVVIVVVSVFVVLFGDPGFDLTEAIWRTLMRTLDPGTMGGDTGSVALPVRRC